MIDLNHSRNLAVRRRACCFLLPFLLPVLMAGFGLIMAGRVTAQNFTVLHSFSGTFPQAGLILSSNTLYGTTAARWGSNTVFKLNADGTGFTTLYSFTALPPWPRWTNSDGAFPDTGVILSGNTLYGTCLVAGSGGGGTVFAVSTDGTGFTLLH